MIANVGDYTIKGIKGEVYPCKPDIFEMTYEKVDRSPLSPINRMIIENLERDDLPPYNPFNDGGQKTVGESISAS